MNIDSDKRALRALARKRLAALTAEYRRAANAAMAEAVLGHPAFQRAGTVFCYVSLPTEPDTGPILRAALSLGKRVCVPRCREKPRMDAVLIRSLDDLAPGTLGIPEPVTGDAVPPGEIGLTLVPCLAADKAGHRLGHGGGYYDAFLAAAPGPALCLCFRELLLPALPAAPWDVPVDAVVTEDGVLPITRAAVQRQSRKPCAL